MAHPDKIYPVIDFHAHVIEPEVYKQAIDHSVATGFGARPMALPEKGSPMWNLFGGMIDPKIQIQDMDRKGIDIGVISTSTVVQSTWWAEPALAAELDRRANERIAEWVRQYPDRFVGTFTCRCRISMWRSKNSITRCRAWV